MTYDPVFTISLVSDNVDTRIPLPLRPLWFTCCFFIFPGDLQPLDVCSVRRKNEILRYSVAMAAYGFFGDVMQDSEKLRWMGPKRYDFSGFKKFMTNR